MENVAANVENGKAVSQKAAKITIWCTSTVNSTSGYVYTQKNWKQGLNTYLYTYVHGSIIHNSQKVETAQKFMERWMIIKMRYIRTRECYS